MIHTTKTEENLQTFPQEVIISIGAKQLPFQVTRDIPIQLSAVIGYGDAAGNGCNARFWAGAGQP